MKSVNYNISHYSLSNILSVTDQIIIIGINRKKMGTAKIMIVNTDKTDMIFLRTEFLMSDILLTAYNCKIRA